MQPVYINILNHKNVLIVCFQGPSGNPGRPGPAGPEGPIVSICKKDNRLFQRPEQTTLRDRNGSAWNGLGNYGTLGILAPSRNEA